MSSFITHGITGLSISKFSNQKRSLPWNIWIILLALFPDVNYLSLYIPSLYPIVNHSHSITFSLILPLLTIIILKIKKVENIRNRSIQLCIAPLSHLFLDLLVGVYPKAYLWPIYNKEIRLPFGILPSAGALNLHNYYLYRNLLIELGIILPILGIIYIFNNRSKIKHSLIKQFLLIIIFIPFLIWSLSLYRG